MDAQQSHFGMTDLKKRFGQQTLNRSSRPDTMCYQRP